ncbi:MULTISPECIES: hypothetical protein [Mammaliicoccus]|uniref:Uncharacterized protein n=2 Tax=Mammaliicoccus lentus TaxID=42858 RepID=A0AAP1WMB2_MAMLE|nr:MULTISPECIES: hypothetical protein [Mammaliicoccus]HBV03279.1 hypothetical protein [Staphylococcus sp.]MBF0795528.1 hypothetical protein [Mammaliicoccus lentus]MBF0842071.1 hypothetical protein [Mammaliicoccus lentus]MBU6113374.1 hypothetical protein [Mammaliicoccus lentus]MBW0762839.1 hypothetical protein [Mammaliicoccus lentus]
MERVCVISLSIIDAILILMLLLFNTFIISNIYVLTVYTLIMVLVSGYIVYLAISMKCDQSINQFDQFDQTYK